MSEEIDVEARLAAAITDPDFEKLELAMREPNIFRALAIERQEIRHSNFFAYLLDPGENHGLGDILLRKFLRDIFADDRAQGRTLFDADLMDFSQVDVRREWRGIDILIDFPQDVIVVENKVDSSEHSQQLSRYRGVVDGEFGAKRKHFVFLTPAGSDPIDEADRKVYINYSYEQIASILANVLELYRDSISDKMALYIDDYLTTINRELLMNDRLNDLARKVYKAHKPAFDFVFENRPDPASVLYPYFEEELKSRGFVIGSKNKGYVRFTSRDLAERLPRTGGGWPDKEAFLFEIDYFWSDQNAVAKAIISPGNEGLRETILSAAKDLKSYRRPEGKKWSSFYLKKSKFVASEVYNEDEGDIRAKVKKVIENIEADANEIFATIAKALSPAQ
ncbi:MULTISPECIES: PD-(D/E)XK nuclease family protein [unclassified Bradyrhizobium]|uniref:PDDEXK-like family protein n=1 Tax=unclassified Bradyrhizobium TaxID=2631580 RepID=UPI0029168981|nr:MULTISPECIES: PD-(D/E)XK nuclease family protein [unclassified Bradyrhizobium]